MASFFDLGIGIWDCGCGLHESEPGAIATGRPDLGLRNADFGFDVSGEDKSAIPNPNSEMGLPSRYRSRF